MNKPNAKKHKYTKYHIITEHQIPIMHADTASF